MAMTRNCCRKFIALPEIADASEQFAADLKAALPEISGVAFFAARSAKAEGQGDPQANRRRRVDTLYIRPGLLRTGSARERFSRSIAI